MTDHRTTLCIVDMQTTFASTAEHCLDAVCHQVKQAIKRNAGIIVLEYTNCGDTYKQIRDLLNSYDRVTYAAKSQMAGGLQVLEAANTANFNTDRVRFVGVLRDHCVYATVKQFSDLVKTQTEVVADATWCSNPVVGLRHIEELGSRII